MNLALGTGAGAVLYEQLHGSTDGKTAGQAFSALLGFLPQGLTFLLSQSLLRFLFELHFLVFF